MTKSRTFAVNVLLVLKIIVNSRVAADGENSIWTHKDTGSSSNAVPTTKDAVTAQAHRNNVMIISPRMDFDEWTPLGRGDPLKNDPTFDYLPPVLERVHYWKSSPAAGNRVHYAQQASTPPPPPPSSVYVNNYNRRFFLTDYSKAKEPYAVMHHPYTVHKRHPPLPQPQLTMTATTVAAGYRYPMPKTPLPMLTPPPYQWHGGGASAQPMTAGPPSTADVSSSSSSSSSSLSSFDPGDATAESKQPPAVRAPPPMSSVRPVLSHSVIKVLLEDEVDRTTVTTTGRTTTTAAMTSTTTPATTTRTPQQTMDAIFAHYKQSATPPPVTGRPMYLIIQGHSKVKTYGLVSKPDGLSAASAQPSAQDHNHIGNKPDDERSRRKRDGEEDGPAARHRSQ